MIIQKHIVFPVQILALGVAGNAGTKEYLHSAAKALTTYPGLCEGWLHIRLLHNGLLLTAGKESTLKAAHRMLAHWGYIDA